MKPTGRAPRPGRAARAGAILTNGRGRLHLRQQDLRKERQDAIFSEGTRPEARAGAIFVEG